VSLLIRPEQVLSFVTPAKAGVQLNELDSGLRRMRAQYIFVPDQ
jgi:hypothetical protein